MTLRQREGVQCSGSLGRLSQRDPRSPLELLGRLTRVAGVFQRLGVVVSEHVRSVLAVRSQRLDPLRRTTVLGRAPGARNLAIGNVAHEDDETLLDLTAH